MGTVTATTTEFPYTARYIRELLSLGEPDFQQMIEVLALPLRNDPVTGALVFNQQEFDLIRRTWEMAKRGEEPNQAAQKVKQLYQPDAFAGSQGQGYQGAGSVSDESTAAMMQHFAGQGGFKPGMTPSGMTQPGGAPVAGATSQPGKTSLAYLVESIASSRDTILQEMSRLLDDRLAGLDEVVVELIRCKTENESLRQKLASALKEKEKAQDEVNRFKPVQFGFYKKV